MDNNTFKYTKDKNVNTIENNDNLLSFYGQYLNEQNISKISSSFNNLEYDGEKLFDRDSEDHMHNMKIFNNPKNYNELRTFLSWDTKLLKQIKTPKDIDCYRTGISWFENGYFFVFIFKTKKIYAFEMTEENKKIYDFCSSFFNKNFEKGIRDLYLAICDNKDMFSNFKNYRVICDFKKEDIFSVFSIDDIKQILIHDFFYGNPFTKSTFFTAVNTEYIKDYKITYDEKVNTYFEVLNSKYFFKEDETYLNQFALIFKSNKKNKYIRYLKKTCEYVYIENKPILVFRNFSYFLGKPKGNKQNKILETARHYVDPFTKKCYVQFYSKDYIFEWKQFDYSKFFSRLSKNYNVCYGNPIEREIFIFLCNPFSNNSSFYFDFSKSESCKHCCIEKKDIKVNILNNNNIYSQNYNSKSTQKYNNFRINIMKKKLDIKIFDIVSKGEFCTNKFCFFERINNSTVVYRFFIFDIFLGMKEYFNVFLNKKDAKCFCLINDKLIPYKGESNTLFSTCLINNVDFKGTFLSFLDKKLIDDLNKRKLNISILPYLSICCYHSQIIEHLLKLKFYNMFFKYSDGVAGWRSYNYFYDDTGFYGRSSFLYFRNCFDIWQNKDLKFNPLFLEYKKNKNDLNNEHKLYHLLSRAYNRSSVADLSINELLCFPIKKLIPVKNEIDSFDKLLNYVVFANLLSINNRDDKKLKILKQYKLYSDILFEFKKPFWNKIFNNFEEKNNYIIRLMQKINYELFPSQYLDCLIMFKRVCLEDIRNMSKEEIIKYKSHFLKNLLKMNDDRFFRLHTEFLTKFNRIESNYMSYDPSIFDSHNYLKNEYEDDDYCIIAPKSYADIKSEGVLMQHCVATYIPIVAEKKTQIYFLRNNKNKEIPLITLEVKKQDLRQAYGYKDSLVSDENIKKFIFKWLKIKKISNSSHCL